MNMFEKLEKNELDMIADYIEAYAGYDADGACLKAPLDHILRFWNTDKTDLFKLFGGNLILTKKINFTKPENQLEDEVSAIIQYQREGYRFYHAFDKWRREQTLCDKYELASLMYSETLAKNTYLGTSVSIDLGDGHKLAVNTGCKASKVLGKIAQHFNLEGYEEFRIAHSQCLNQKKLTGELCLSIHPLDYMTMSDNDCDWSSCMSWRECGDYRQGTVEMMNSPYIVVAYLKSSSNMHIPGGHEWNSKKWRQLFIVTPHIIAGIREYPYACPEISGIALQWLRDLAQTNALWGPYGDTAVEVKNHYEFSVAYLDRTLELDFTTNFMYNDFYNRHLAYIAPSIPDHYTLCFSGVSECMICGDDITCRNNGGGCTSLLSCDACEEVFWCDECGERVSPDDLISVDGNHVCSYCYENYYDTCTLCKETHHNSDSSYVYLRCDGQISCYYIKVCSNCLNDFSFKEKFGEAKEVPHGRWDTRTVVDVENFANLDALDYFEIWGNDDYEVYKACLESKSSDEN